jgi:hypothetical protein
MRIYRKHKKTGDEQRLPAFQRGRRGTGKPVSPVRRYPREAGAAEIFVLFFSRQRMPFENGFHKILLLLRHMFRLFVNRRMEWKRVFVRGGGGFPCPPRDRFLVGTVSDSSQSIRSEPGMRLEQYGTHRRTWSICILQGMGGGKRGLPVISITPNKDGRSCPWRSHPRRVEWTVMI